MEKLKTEENKTKIKLTVPHVDTDHAGQISNSEIENAKNKILSALKIITIAGLADDETSEDFFSSFDNYRIITTKLKSLKILSENIPMEEESFFKNPPDCWMKVIIAIFVSLYSFPDNNKVYCDSLTMSESKNNSERKVVGTYLTTMLRLEAYDWNEHKVDLFIPNEIGDRVIFIIDEEPALYTLMS